MTGLDLMVCVGSSCHLQDSREVIKRFKELIEEFELGDQIELKGSFCMGHCAEQGVCVKYDDKTYGVTLDIVDHFFKHYVSKCE